MLKQKRRHQVALAGQVINALTGDAIAGARIKIVQAPDQFIDVVIFKAQLFGLPESLWVKQSYSRILNAPLEYLSPKIQEFHEGIIDPKINNREKLETFKILIADPSLNNRQKFQALQNILDYFQSDKLINAEYPERKYSTLDGWFYFTDLPTGSYTSFSDRLKLVLKLNPTTVFGKVTDSITNELIDMAKVEVYQNEDYAISSRTVNQNGAGKWNYRLVAVEPNKPFTTLIVSARGYITQRHEVYLQKGDIKQLDFQLVSL